MAQRTRLTVDNRGLRENDIVILVTGLLGSGKSSFINTLLGKKHMDVGETLSSGTTEIDYEIIDPIPDHNLQNRRLVIVDTPGLNDKVSNDNKTLGDIVDWVEASGVKEIAGVVYLYDIFQEKHSSISKVDLVALRASFQGSEDAFKRVILVTTKWGNHKHTADGMSEGETREKELKSTFWKDLIDRGSQVKRFQDSVSSAWEIVNALLVQAGEDDVFNVRSQLTKLRTNLNANKKSDTRKDIFTVPIFGMSSWGPADKSRETYFVPTSFDSHTTVPRKIVIPVMGPTGAGKSTFINTLLGEQRMIVGRTLKSQTVELDDALLDMSRYSKFGGSYQIVVVDTPGFDDTVKSDVAILKKIADWLEKSYKEDGTILGGVIYLHDISLDRFTGTAQRNLDIFRALCGQDALSKVILGTTKWDRISKSSAQAHEEKLQRDHWRTLIEKGAKVRSFKDKHDIESAWKLFIDPVVAMVKKENLNETYLQIQRELGDQKKIIPETDAGRALRATLKEILDMEKQVAGLERNMAVGGDDKAQEKLREAEEQIGKLLKQIDELKVPLSRKFRRFFGF